MTLKCHSLKNIILPYLATAYSTWITYLILEVCLLKGHLGPEVMFPLISGATKS